MENSAVRSIPQSEADHYFVEFFQRRSNTPAQYAELVEALGRDLQANSNQAASIINRAHAKTKILVKDGKNYKLNTDVMHQSSVVGNIKLQILNFRRELDKNISLNDVKSAEEFTELKALLEKLEELSQ